MGSISKTTPEPTANDQKLLLGFFNPTQIAGLKEIMKDELGRELSDLDASIVGLHVSQFVLAKQTNDNGLVAEEVNYDQVKW